MTDIQGFRHIEETIKEPYHYTACGLDNIYLFNGYELHQTEDGDGVSIRDLGRTSPCDRSELGRTQETIEPERD